MNRSKTIKNSSLVSVIIPTYNGSNTILRAINSVLNQTYSNLELIKLEYEKGKQMWQNTPEYLKRVQMEEENRINNLKRKTEPSGRHREAKLLKKKQLKKERNQ